MRRREFIALMGASATWPFAAIAQEPGRTYRLGVLSAGSRSMPASVAMIDELRRLGFIESQNLTIDFRNFAQHVDLLSEYAADLVKAKPDVIYAGGGVVVRAVQQATRMIPIVGAADDMIGEGLVESLARPNGNTTGISILNAELDGKRQEILIETVPGIRRMAALADSGLLTETTARALQDAAHERGIDLSIYRVAKGSEIAAAIDLAHESGAMALNVLASPMLFGNGRMIMERVAALRLPAMYQWPEMADEGGLVAYGPSFTHIRVLAARLMGKILQGIKVADIPVEQPTKFELVINLKTADTMGFTVPATLARADKVIE
jgi:putative ABC transport system substrate-binding protein